MLLNLEESVENEKNTQLAQKRELENMSKRLRVTDIEI